MSASQFEIFVAIYVIVGAIYICYRAYIIAVTAVGAEHRARLFYRMLYNPFWRTLEQDLLRSQSAEFRALVSKTETITYVFIAGGILLGGSLEALEYSPQTIHFDMDDGIMIYLAVGAAYFCYQAYLISNMPTDAGIKLRLFFKMILTHSGELLKAKPLHHRVPTSSRTCVGLKLSGTVILPGPSF